MGFNAEVLRVLIASPSDVAQERDEIEKAIFKWNTVYAEKMKVVLLPARWENVAPTYRGEDPQQILNDKLVSKCDILIGVFWKKLGSATAGHQSGTLEEIDIFVQKGKEIMLYFVNKPINLDDDLREVEKVKAYKKEYQTKGLYNNYDITKIVEHLYEKVTDYKKDSAQEKNTPTFQYSTTIINNDERLFLESIILSGVLTDSEILLLKYIKDEEVRHLGSAWSTEEALDKISEWEEENILSNKLSKNYDNALINLNERDILEITEYTNAGIPRVYELRLSKFDQLRQLSQDVANILEGVKNDYTIF